LVSFDGGNGFRPWSGPDGQPEWKTRGGWYHVDQGKGKPKKCCVQGVVPFTDATEATGGLVVIPGSHKNFTNLIQRNGLFACGDFMSIPESDPILSGTTAALICAKAGDLLLWDSRTVHCNTPGLKPRDELARAEPSELLRIAGYVCMTPRRWATWDVLRKRRTAFQEKSGTSHWPHTFTSANDGLCALDDRADALAKAPAAVRNLVDGGDKASWGCAIL
jgi:hypothetical protein